MPKNQDLKVKNSDLDNTTVSNYEEQSSVYKLIMRDIIRSIKVFFKLYDTYKKNHIRLGDLIYEASHKTGTDDWKKYEITSKSEIMDSDISDRVDSKYVVPIINKVQIQKLPEKEVQKSIREMGTAYKGLKKILEKLQKEIDKYDKLNKVLLYDIDTVKFLIKRKEY